MAYLKSHPANNKLGGRFDLETIQSDESNQRYVVTSSQGHEEYLHRVLNIYRRTRVAANL